MLGELPREEALVSAEGMQGRGAISRPPASAHSRCTGEGCTSVSTGLTGGLRPTQQALRSWGRSAPRLHLLELRDPVSCHCRVSEDRSKAEQGASCHLSPRRPQSPHGRYPWHNFIFKETMAPGDLNTCPESNKDWSLRTRLSHLTHIQWYTGWLSSAFFFFFFLSLFGGQGKVLPSLIKLISTLSFQAFNPLGPHTPTHPTHKVIR